MLIEKTIFGETIDKIQIAIDRLKHFEPPEGYYLAFSGGKDSVVIKELANMSGVKYDAHYNNTTIDPPELVKFIRQHHKDVRIEHPEEPFLKVLVHKGFPRRKNRWCCSEYKEGGGNNRFVITGIRWQESKQRSNRRMIEVCMKDKTKKFLHLIIDWSEHEVWEFIHKYNLPYCKLYDEGWKRIGCLLCPLASTKQRLIQSKLYPKYTKAFINAFRKLYNKRKTERPETIEQWNSGEEMFWQWMKSKKQSNKDQMVMFE